MRYLFLLLLFINPLQAEKLVPSLSSHRVVITPNFTGTDLVLYGLIERDGQSIGRGSGYDIVIVMRGENETITIREKSRQFGFWLNEGRLTLPPVPNALSIYANRPLKDIADFDQRTPHMMGLDSLLPQLGNDPSRLALLRLQQEKGLYTQNENGVVFLTPQWFRTRLRLTSNIPTGQYRVDVYLLTGGVMVARGETAFEVVKTGIEAFISREAKQHSWIYGLITAFIAALSGLLGFLIFRRD
jgi:uncharacterized protein (TIGR02186 family)